MRNALLGAGERRLHHEVRIGADESAGPRIIVTLRWRCGLHGEDYGVFVRQETRERMPLENPSSP